MEALSHLFRTAKEGKALSLKAQSLSPLPAFKELLKS